MGQNFPKHPDSDKDEQVFCSLSSYSSYQESQQKRKKSSRVFSNSLEYGSSKYSDTQQFEQLRSSTLEEGPEFLSGSSGDLDSEENDSSSEYEWRFNSYYSSDLYCVENYSTTEYSSGLVSDSDVDFDSGRNDSPLEYDRWLNSKWNADPYYEENDSNSEESPGLISTSDAEDSDSFLESYSDFNTDNNTEVSERENNSLSSEQKNSLRNKDNELRQHDFITENHLNYPDCVSVSPPSEKCSVLHKTKPIAEKYLMIPDIEKEFQFSKFRFDIKERLVAKNEHSMLLQFYEELVDDLMVKFSIEYGDVCSSLQHMICNHGGIVNGRLPLETNYCDKSYCLAYLHRYAACHSAMISETVSTILRSPFNVLHTKFNKEQLNVMFLGGGPGNDFVGFLTALYCYRKHLLDLDVIVVDKMSGWKDVFNETVQKLKHNECGEFYRLFDDVILTTSFISADLKKCEEWSFKMRIKLMRADIIFLVKVLSHIPNDDKLGVLKNIIIYTKPGALLIYVDHPYPQKAFASVSGSLRLVYKSRIKRYTLRAKKLKFGNHNTTRCTAEVRIFERY